MCAVLCTDSVVVRTLYFHCIRAWDVAYYTRASKMATLQRVVGTKKVGGQAPRK